MHRIEFCKRDLLKDRSTLKLMRIRSPSWMVLKKVLISGVGERHGSKLAGGRRGRGRKLGAIIRIGG
ncbi:hypothetical protein LINPERHAP1_LOCUS10253 [Linum perenne]